MNITAHTTNLPLATVVNPPTEGLRRENHQREIITRVIATHPSTAEKSVATDKERALTPAQVNAQVDFASLRKDAEHAASSITDQGHHQGEQGSQHNEKQQQSNKEVSAHELAHTTAHTTVNGADNTQHKKLASKQDTNTVQSTEVLQRADRIENFYFNISQGYEKPDDFYFELTA